MSPKQLKEKYLSLKKEAAEVRRFDRLSHILRYWQIQREKYRVYEQYKNALMNKATPEHSSDSNPPEPN